MALLINTAALNYREATTDPWQPLAIVADANLESLADVFSTDGEYTEGELVMHDGLLYKCGAGGAGPGPWDATEWTETSIKAELEAIGTEISGIKDTLNSLDSDDIANASTNVSGATVTAAIDNLNTALATVPDFAPKTAIPQNSNLNDYRTAGTYYVQTDAIAATIGNMPRSASGTLIVIIRGSGNTYLQQFYLPTSTIKKIYTRTYNNGTWTSWGEIPTDIFVITGTRTTSAAGTTDFAETYNCNQYMCLSVVATGAVAGYILLPYKYGDAANGRWGFQALKSGDLSTIKTTSIAYAAVMMKYA